ncbi:MAG: hypothetical protein LBT80_08285, partial [Lactobacillaceae bacterium]|nr:hypothetical protein [Lactobacillaceae bacterium]
LRPKSVGKKLVINLFPTTINQQQHPQCSAIYPSNPKSRLLVALAPASPKTSALVLMIYCMQLTLLESIIALSIVMCKIFFVE